MAVAPLHSTDHAKGRFAPHGAIQVWPEGSVIRYDVTGPFNIEGIKAFAHTIASLLDNWQPDGPHGSISFWHESMMASPDALAAYAHVLRSGRERYPKEVINVWFVPREIEGRLIMQSRWQNIYHENGYSLEIVHDETEARERIRTALIDARNN